MQQKMAAGENPAAEMIKSVSLDHCRFAAFITGLFTDFLGLLLFYRRARASDSEVDAAFALFSYARRRFSAGTGGGNTFDGEYQRKDDERDRLDHKEQSPGNLETPDYVVMHPFHILALRQQQP